MIFTLTFALTQALKSRADVLIHTSMTDLRHYTILVALTSGLVLEFNKEGEVVQTLPAHTGPVGQVA